MEKGHSASAEEVRTKSQLAHLHVCAFSVTFLSLLATSSLSDFFKLMGEEAVLEVSDVTDEDDECEGHKTHGC